MGVFVKYSDFVGSYSYAVHQNNIAQAENEITIYEKKYLIKVFGLDMANDLLANPTTPESLALISELYTNCGQYSRGLKECLLGFVRFELNKSGSYVGTVSGTKKVDQDLVDANDSLWLVLNNQYNDSVRDARAMSLFSRDKTTDYPLFKQSERLLLNINL